jgi:hypothetical protein
MATMLKAATLKHDLEFNRTTGRQMGEALQRQLDGVPKACWLFCAPLRGLEELLKGICEGAGTDVIVGCTSDGEISSAGLSMNSAVLAGIISDHIDFEIVTIQGLESDSTAAGRRLADAFSSTPKYIQIFSDGLTGNGCAIIEGIASVVGEHLPITGGAAGDNGRFIKTLQFGNGRIYTDAISGIAFHGDFHLGTGLASGWTPIGLPKQVTKASGNVVYELNGEPALNVYERFLGDHAHKLPAIGVEYPLGYQKASTIEDQEDLYILRATMSVDRKARSITFAGEIPVGAQVNLTCGDNTSILAAAGKASKQARSAFGDVTPGIIFCYSCMARKIVLGSQTDKEIKQVQAEFGSQVPLIGFYTYGEYCPAGCTTLNYLHNETITLNVVGTSP